MSRRDPVLGEIVPANEVLSGRPSPQRARNIIYLLAASVALMMTGFGIIMPIFARRLTEFGAGVEALGIMTMSFALTQLIAAPIMGTLSDRIGRKPLILIALFAFALANIGYLLAPNTAVFIAIRAIAGAFTAGLFPAAMGVVGDIMPEKERGRWIGIVMAGYGAGFVFGPVLGGVLYDSLGFAAPFIISAVLALFGLIAAAIFVPETRPASVRHRDALRSRRAKAMQPEQSHALWKALPRPLSIFFTLLFIDFIGAFAFAYVEPQMVFYFYDDLNWTTIQFGLVVGAYGLSMLLGQTILGQSSDRVGRKPIILIGVLLNATLYIGLAIITRFGVMMGVAVLAGLGSALIAPAASAFYLDITTPRYRGRILGIKESALALGGVLGPLTVAVTARFLTPQQIFLSAAAITILALLLALFLLREPEQKQASSDPAIDWEINKQRTISAQGSLRGLVILAQTSRQKRAPNA